MRVISVITPAHQDKWLKRAYDSLVVQRLQPEWTWEWIVVVNGDLTPETARSTVGEDDRVRIVAYPLENKNVGALKGFACGLASGEYYAELDYDDELRPGCLAAVIEAFKENPTASMVYTDTCAVRDDGTFHTFGPDYGWTYRNIDETPIPNSPPLLPQNVARLWYSPDHVRAWRASTYKAVDGHDSKLEICDDVDLTCKLFARGPIIHIPEWGYTYHIHGENTWIKKNKDIQTKAWEIYRTRIESVIMAHCRRENLPMWDLGGAYHPRPGWNVIDISQPCQLQADLNETWPIKSDSVGAFRAHDALEHLNDSIHTMNEAWRCLVPGGMFLIEVPSTDGRGAAQDPTHCCYSEDTRILSEGGFKSKGQIQVGDLVWTYNQNRKRAELQPVVAVHEYNYEGDMIHFEGRNYDCLVTPNHNHAVAKFDRGPSKSPDYSLVRADELMSRRNYRTIGEVLFDGDETEYFEVPDWDLSLNSFPGKKIVNGSVRLKIEPFMRFMGWYLSEGCLAIDEESSLYRICISQSSVANKERFEILRQDIESLGFKPVKAASGNGFSFSSKHLARWLKPLGKSPDKYVPRELMALSPRLLRFMLEGLLLGDGKVRHDDKFFAGDLASTVYCTISPRLRDDVAEVALKCGFRVNVSTEKRIGKLFKLPRSKIGAGRGQESLPDYRAKYDMFLVSIYKAKSRSHGPGKKVPYVGKVWCVTVSENHIILSERNGSVAWSGNSFWNLNSVLYYGRFMQRRFIQPRFVGAFHVVLAEDHYPSQWHERYKILYTRFHLAAIKPGYNPYGIDSI